MSTGIQSFSLLFSSSSSWYHFIIRDCHSSPQWRSILVDTVPIVPGTLTSLSYASACQVNMATTPGCACMRLWWVTSSAFVIWSCISAPVVGGSTISNSSRKTWSRPLSGWSLSSNALKHAHMRTALWHFSQLLMAPGKPARLRGPVVLPANVTPPLTTVARTFSALLHKTCDWC